MREIMLRPEQEWDVIATETAAGAPSLLRFLLVLATLSAVLQLVVALSILEIAPDLARTFHWRERMLERLVTFDVLLLPLSALLLASVANYLAPRYSGRRDALRAMKLGTYTSTPIWLASPLMAVPWLGVVVWTILGLYWLRLFQPGARALLGIPDVRLMDFMVAHFFICAVAGTLLMLLGIFGQQALVSLATGS